MESYRDGIYRIKFPAPEEMSAIRVKLFTGSSGMFLGSFGQNMLLTIKIKLFLSRPGGGFIHCVGSTSEHKSRVFVPNRRCPGLPSGACSHKQTIRCVD